MRVYETQTWVTWLLCIAGQPTNHNNILLAIFTSPSIFYALLFR